MQISDWRVLVKCDIGVCDLVASTVHTGNAERFNLVFRTLSMQSAGLERSLQRSIATCPLVAVS